MKTHYSRFPADPDSFDTGRIKLVEDWFSFSIGLFVGTVLVLFLMTYFMPQIIASDDQAVGFCRQVIQSSNDKALRAATSVSEAGRAALASPVNDLRYK